ncbi:hypothetical protein ABFX02_14G025200 [Erythranthe guttata]
MQIQLILVLCLYFATTIHAKKNLVLPIIINNANNATANSSSAAVSPWLMGFRNPRFMGCRRRPWICNDDQGGFPRIRRRCCRNRCVDVSSDVNNCGLCGIRCLFTRQCCRGLCVNTNRNPFHCGRCDNRCPFPSLCFYGMCGYAQPLPPFPFPFPPRPRPRPRPPKPFPPPRPPRPWPFPPRQMPPRPCPPKGGRRDAPPPAAARVHGD